MARLCWWRRRDFLRRTIATRGAGEYKPTNPTNQAQQWYSHALLKVMRLQTKYPNAIVALGFPDFPRYRALFQETRGGLEKLGVAFFSVRESGEVDAWGFGTAPLQGSEENAIGSR